MRKSQLLISVVCLLSIIHGGVSQAFGTFNSANGEMILEIEDVDIDPSNTPTPLPGVTKPAPTTSSPSQQLVTPTPIPFVQEKSEVVRPPKPDDFFSFSMMQSEIDFGIVDPTNPVIRTHDLRIDPGSANGMSLFAYENHPLKVQNAEPFIPDTTCDHGQCSQLLSSLWENTLTYGFGFRCDNAKGTSEFCAQNFVNQQYFRQFADVSKKEVAADIMTRGRTTEPAQARITYKLNIPGTQTPGDYTNVVVFIAAPTY